MLHRSLTRARHVPAALYGLALLLLATIGVSAPAQAQLQLRIGGGSFQPMPIAVTDFSGDANLGGLVSSVVTNDLRRSGYFLPLEKGRFPESPN
ncbi:MAG: Tol-Pal system protein TolB, partial [Methylobacterium sp.]